MLWVDPRSEIFFLLFEQLFSHGWTSCEVYKCVLLSENSQRDKERVHKATFCGTNPEIRIKANEEKFQC